MNLWQESWKRNRYFQQGYNTVTIFKKNVTTLSRKDGIPPGILTIYRLSIHNTLNNNTTYHDGFKTEQAAIDRACELFGIDPPEKEHYETMARK